MLKAKQKMRSILLVCLMMLATLILGLGSLFSAPTTTASAADTEIVFELGANGSAIHYDGTSKTTYSETVNGYTLSVTNGSSFYTGARDAKGNSCFKLGTGSKAGSFSLTAPSDVTKVIIYVAQYKANTTKITVSGSSYTITTASDNGTYTAVEVDTSSNKTVSFTTVSGGYRAMVNTITFVIPESSESACDHSGTEESWIYDSVSKEHYQQCTLCENEIEGTRAACSDFNYGDYTTVDGKHTRTATCTVCGNEQTETGDCEIIAETAEYVREGNTHTQTGTCLICDDTTTVTEDCTLSYENVSNDDKTHNTTSTCSVCNQSVTTENVACTFEETLDGTTLIYTCKYCEYSYTEEATMYTVTYDVPKEVTTPPSGTVAEGSTTELPTADDYQKYTFVGWVTEELEGDTNTAPEFMKAGYEYTVTADVTLYALYTYTEGNTEETWNLVTDASSLAVGKEIVITALPSEEDTISVLSTNQKSSNRGSASVSCNGASITIGNENTDVQIITLEAGTVDSTFAFNVGDSYLYAASSSGNQLKTKTTLDNNGSWNITIDANGVATIQAQGSNSRKLIRYNPNNGSPLFSCYDPNATPPTGTLVSIYMKDGGAITYYTTSFVEEGGHSHSYDEGVVTDPTCTEKGYTTYTCACGDTYTGNYVDATGHSYEEEITQDATCTEAGEKTFTCSVCSHSYTEAIPANGHQFVDGECSCGAKQDKKTTLTFDDTSKRTAFSTSEQVWKENGITVTNAKASSTTNVANYSNPVRFYKSSTVTIEYPDMTVVEIAANSNAYATALGNSIAGSVVDGSTVILMFTEAQNSYTFTCSEQIRVNAITAYTTPTHIDSASITVGENLTLNYYVIMPEIFAAAQMTFTVAGKEYSVEGTLVGGRYVFSLEIPPHYMAENVKAELIFNEITITQKDTYSIKEYTDNQLDKVENSIDEKDIQLTKLLNAITAYGVAAANYKAETNTAGENVIPENENVFNLENEAGVEQFGAYFTGANVWFDNTNKIMVLINTTENVTMKINGTEVAVTGTTIYTDELLPTQFNDTYTFELYYDGNLMQTLTYSVNSYAYKMQTNENIGALAIALYNYGVAAETYATPLS